MASPEPGMTSLPDPSIWDRPVGRRRDDPVTTAIVTRATAEKLGHFYVSILFPQY
jgi:hypothetical protein